MNRSMANTPRACWLVVLASGLSWMACTQVIAKVSPDEAVALGDALTPIGAEAGANPDGSIPAWTPLKINEYERGDDPFEDDEPLFTITSANAAQYSSLLSEGHKALFATFPKSYEMRVYPSRRSAAYPDWFLEATRRNATEVELTHDGNGFCCAAKGFPFPIPKSGLEVMWNHIMRYNTRGYRGYLASAATSSSGSHVVERSYVELSYVYNDPDMTVDALDNRNLNLMSKVVSPASKAGASLLIRLPIDRIKETPGVWSYSASANRQLRVGEVGYDQPAYEGLMTQDQIDMFNGPLDRYSIKLLGKREMIVPYNSFMLYDDDLDYEEIITKGHPRQSLVRYEKHRVWVIEANVREGQSHLYKKRVFYVDEDSWIVLTQDIYDQRDEFWRFAESHSVNFAHVPVLINGVQVHYDLQSRRYVILNLVNEEEDLIEYDWTADPSYFTPSGLKRFAQQRR